MNLLILLNYILIVFSSALLTEQILQAFVYSGIILCALYAFRFCEYIDDLRESIIRSAVGILSGSLFILLVCKLFKGSYCSWKLAILMVTLSVVLPVVNYIVAKTLLKKRNTIKYLVVGNREELFPLLKEIEEESKGRYQFVDYINPSPVAFKEKVKHFDNILIADPKLEGNIQEELEQIKQSHKIEYLPNLAEKVLKRIPLEVMKNFEEYYKVYFDNIQESPAKRVMDIVFSLIGLVVYSPVILISAVWILIEDGPPVLFRQPRVGKNEKIFEMVKLRSLRNAQIDPTNPNKDIEQRVLKIGKFIRKTRIDESIQFWLILKGKMSLVGPRPEMIEYHEMMKPHIPYYTYRLLVKPGLTGWAQINYKHSSTLEEYKIKTEYDLYYVKNRTIFMDLKILLLTFETLIFRKGAK